MYIQDIEGKFIKINDVKSSIQMVRDFLSFEQKHEIPSLVRLEEHRRKYWEDILQKLLALDSGNMHD